MSEEIRETADTVSFPPLVNDAVVLTGPTASGKSSVALCLAERLDGEILSLDSIAVYRGMDIGTAKPTSADRAQLPHHLIDLVDPNEEFSVACYLQAAHEAVADICERGRTPIFVGGTPMFLKGVLRGFDPGPPADWEFRKAVEKDLERHGAEALRERLQQVDPLAAHRIGPNDTRRMIRALEVARFTGTPISHRQVQFDRQLDAKECNVFSLQWDRAELHNRINDRVKEMFDRGLLDEVRELLQRFGDLSRTASQAVGYREVIEWLQTDNNDTSDLVEEVSAHTRQLARRQETWLRSFAERRLIEMKDSIDPDEIACRIARELVR
ncbi:MAG: tRNA (adenosine(37)-N6)-dimethylallyltransferase MiaA [Rubripirellula sp.]